MGKLNKLSMTQYCDFVSDMASKKSMKNLENKLGTAGLGLAGEAGEVADLIKKVLYQGKEFNDETRELLIKELGDLLWYCAFTCRNVLDLSFEEVATLNVEKLQQRYKTGKFTTKEFKAKEKAKSVETEKAPKSKAKKV